MKRFKFRLEKVLEHREMEKAERKRELMVCNLKLAEEQEKLLQLEQAFGANLLAGEGILTSEQVLLCGSFGARIKEEMGKQRDAISVAQAEVEKAMERYIAAAREEKALSTLKAKKRTEYDAYVQKEDEKFVDELMTQKGNTLLESDDER